MAPMISGMRRVQLRVRGSAVAGTSIAMSVVIIGLVAPGRVQCNWSMTPSARYAATRAVLKLTRLDQRVARRNDRSLRVGGLHAPRHARLEPLLRLGQLQL